MKLKAWLLLTLTSLTAVSLMAQVSNSAPPDVSPPMAPAPGAPSGLAVENSSTNAVPAPKHHHKKAKAAAKHAEKHEEKAPAVKSDVILNPPVSATVKCEVLDIRGQDSFVGEVIGHVKKGETVTVLEEISRGHVHPGEPAEWSRIALPTNVNVWVDGDYIADTNTVRVKKINLRGGPGENYSVVGRLEKGDAINIIKKKGNWLEIEAPTNASAFVASEFLDKGAPAVTPAVAETTPPPPVAAPAPAPQPVVVNVPTETTPAPAPAATPVEAAPAPAAPAPTALPPSSPSENEQALAALHQAEGVSTPAPPAAVAPTPAPAPAAPAAEEPPRIITRDGFVHRAWNIQAPAGYELHDIKTGVLTEYLQPPAGDKKFKAFVGTRVRITGTEYLDPGFPRTPVLQIQSVDLMP